MPEPMTDERLAEIEADGGLICWSSTCGCVQSEALKLVAEIRRLLGIMGTLSVTCFACGLIGFLNTSEPLSLSCRRCGCPIGEEPA